MITPEDVLAIFAEQQALEAKILNQCVLIERAARPFAEWNTMWESQCVKMVERLNELLTMTQQHIKIHRDGIVWIDWHYIEEETENTIIATVAYKKICGSYKESDLHQRLRISKEHKKIDARVKEAIDNSQQWRINHFRALFNEELHSPRLSLVTVTEEKANE